MGDKYCIENDFAAQKELAEMERASIDEQWMARSELNALKLRAERAEAKLATWQKDMNAVLRQRDDIHNRVARLEEALKKIADGRGTIPDSSTIFMNGKVPEIPKYFNKYDMQEIARRALRES